MQKLLSLSLLLLLAFAFNTKAQDTTAKKLAVDTSAKTHPADTIAKKATDTTAKKPVVVVDTIKRSPVRTLTSAQYNALLKGDDYYNMAQVAEINHYPLPDKVLKHKKQLDLSPTQATKITAIATELHRKRVEMGGIIIHNEQVIDSLFRTNKVYDGNIIYYTNRYGLYQGELRNAILQACYATQVLLSPMQVKRLETLENHK